MWGKLDNFVFLSKRAHETESLRKVTSKERETAAIKGSLEEGRQAEKAWGQFCFYF